MVKVVIGVAFLVGAYYCGKFGKRALQDPEGRGGSLAAKFGTAGLGCAIVAVVLFVTAL